MYEEVDLSALLAKNNTDTAFTGKQDCQMFPMYIATFSAI